MFCLVSTTTIFMYQRIVILKPCCIGDVIFATPLLLALRRAYPTAVIDWAGGGSARAALSGHPALETIHDTGGRANPASRPLSLLRAVLTVRRGAYDLAVTPDRSRLLGLIPLLAGIPVRAGLDSGGRGFAHTIRAPIDPAVIRHEADIYLDVGRALGIHVEGVYAECPPPPEAHARAEAIMTEHHLQIGRFVIVHPGGGVNAGMTMTIKRYPPLHMAALADRLSRVLGDIPVVSIGAASDREALAVFRAAAQAPLIDLAEQLTLREIGALAVRAALYVGNDNGVGHLAAASGGKVLMIFGPSDPRRYAPFVPPDRARVAWRTMTLPTGGVGGAPPDFRWERDGVTVDEAFQAALPLLV
ncbi:MAG TPA: glycosyltransferase family 9 protein [Aggregatilineales bacterium]|nr:glycosyltransferase family 9 protein [Anaerolineales bacterium]HRE48297.1 glycosyltransferase family 9 protein [Aggregatilineales bacterium]